MSAGAYIGLGKGRPSMWNLITPRAQGGSSTVDNLPWSCPSCNLHKFDRIDATDPESGLTIPLFHPHRDFGSGHFRWVGYRIMGLTPKDRAIVRLLNLKAPAEVAYPSS